MGTAKPYLVHPVSDGKCAEVILSNKVQLHVNVATDSEPTRMQGMFLATPQLPATPSLNAQHYKNALLQCNDLEMYMASHIELEHDHRGSARYGARRHI